MLHAEEGQGGRCAAMDALRAKGKQSAGEMLTKVTCFRGQDQGLYFADMNGQVAMRVAGRPLASQAWP